MSETSIESSPDLTFRDLALGNPLWNALDDMGLQRPTPIQHEVFPLAMSGRDLIGIAQTGTGKTIAYLLPCIKRWQFNRDRSPQILVLVPTRELVQQVAEVAKELTRYTSIRVAGIYGGVNMIQQQHIVTEGCDLLVATPGRLMDFLLKGTLKMRHLKMLVIDEMDEMLAQGFRHAITQVLELLPARRQNLLFSATITPDIEVLALQHFEDPVKLTASSGPLAGIAQSGWRVPNFHTKVNLLTWLLEERPEMTKVLVFASTKKLADKLHHQLEFRLPETSSVIHSNKAQQQRFGTVEAFGEGSLRVLIATDIVARGIDVSGVTHVINFDLPESPEQYIHRIGRTGRAKASGTAICFVTEADMPRLTAMEDLMRMKVPMEDIPEDVAVSEQLLPEEKPVVVMKSVTVTLPKPGTTGGAFHEKKEKNRKTINLRPIDKARAKSAKKGKAGGRKPTKRR